jgi:hypothetical protein
MSMLTLSSFLALVITIAEFIVIASITIGVIIVVWAGILYITAGDDLARAGEAKSRAIRTVISLLIVLSVGLIIQTLASATRIVPFFNV